MRAHPVTWLPLLAWLTLPSGCVGSGSSRTHDSGQVRSGPVLVADAYPAETADLRELAAMCEAGAAGRRAVLLLATAALDPRNPDADADRAARLAAVFLGLPRARGDERALAETLYLLALDRGAVVDTPADTLNADSSSAMSTAEGPGEPLRVAARFHDCSADVGRATAPDALPTLPGEPLAGAATERDSLQARVRELEAELERIRTLLQEDVTPDTAGRGA